MLAKVTKKKQQQLSQQTSSSNSSSGSADGGGSRSDQANYLTGSDDDADAMLACSTGGEHLSVETRSKERGGVRSTTRSWVTLVMLERIELS